MTSEAFPRKPVPVALGLCGLNLLIPGAGFFACGDKARGIALFLIVNFCFIVGVAMGGYILAPLSWRPMTAEFNLVTVLTYLSQSFHVSGWLAIQGLQRMASDNLDSYFNIIALGTRTYSDLGSFHYIVAGSLNYFATVRLYDLLAGTPEASSPAATEPATAAGVGETA